MLDSMQLYLFQAKKLKIGNKKLIKFKKNYMKFKKDNN
jgi:hypothetical protein